jgi:hypothetical protein
LPKAALLQKLTKSIGSLLTSPIRMNNRSGLNLSFADGFMQSRNHQLSRNFKL